MSAPLILVALSLLSAGLVRAMIALRLMDEPDAGQPGARKAHLRPVPKGGGVGVVVAFVAGCGIAAGLGHPLPYPGAVLAALGIAAVAFLDDVQNWSFAVKLGAQVLGAVAAVAGGLVLRRLELPGWGVIDLGWTAVPVTLAWFLFATNAMNFIDGLNGLAAGASLLAGALWTRLVPDAAADGGALLAAGLAGFLPFNFPRARIFMGDVGSQFCGFILAALAVAGGLFLLMVFMLFGILFDVAVTLVRRTWAGERLTQAHRGHLYQVAQRSGVGAPLIAILHWSFVAWGALCATLPVVWAGPLVVAPQLAWVTYVIARSRQAGLRSW